MTKRIWIISRLFVAALLLAGGIFVARPAYRQFKARRALRQAASFMDHKDFRNAALCLQVALAVNPTNAAASRLVADLLDQGQSSAALAWRKRVMEIEPSIENKLLFAACALRYEKPPFPQATTALQSIGKEGETNVNYHLIQGQLALSAGDLPKSESHLSSAMRLDPTNKLFKLNLATVRMQSKDLKVAEAAREELVKLAADRGLGITALRSLTADCLGRKDFAPAEKFARQLQLQPAVTLNDRFLCLSGLKSAKAPDFDEALARVQSECATNASTLAQAIAWMNGERMAKQALDWVAGLQPTTRDTMPVPIVVADCYIATTNFPGLQQHLTARKWEDQEFLRLALLGRAAREQGEEAHGARLWKQACNETLSNPERMAVLLQLARTWNWQTEFRNLLWMAVDRAPSQQWALQMLVKDYWLHNDTEGLYRVYATLLERDKNSVEFKNNVAALGLLLGTNVTRCAEMARESYECAKTNATVVSTYAFALHKQGKTGEALKLFAVVPDTELHRPDIALYYGVLLAAAGDLARAQPYLEAAEKRRPFPEERVLLDNARASRN